jgi:carotenoid cleavage dioxygenase
MSTASAARNQYLEDNFAPVDQELTVTDLAVTGTIPKELNGRYMRNGPNPIGAVDPETYHWFTGTGMVHGVQLGGGRAGWYRNRWVRARRPSAELGEPDVPGPQNGDGGAYDFGPNTNVGGFAGRTWAFVEAGAFPVELDHELDTVCRNDFFGTLPGAFSAHPKFDPATGELHAMCYDWSKWLDHVQYVVVGPDGRVSKTVDIPLPGMTMLHDTALTPTMVAVFDLPVLVDLDLAFAGRFPFRWSDGYQARVGLLPRDADDARAITWFEIDPCYTYHPLNAFDLDENTVVIDTVVHSRMFLHDILGPSEADGRLTRWTFRLDTGAFTSEVISEQLMEFPRHNPSVGTKRHRFGFGVETVNNVFDLAGLVKIDCDTGSTLVRSLGDGQQASEAVFVAKEGATDEDDGWLLSLSYDPARDASDLVIIDAADFLGPEVGRVHLPQRVPFGFHGNFVTDPRG